MAAAGPVSGPAQKQLRVGDDTSETTAGGQTDGRTDRWRMTPCVRNVMGSRQGWVLVSFRKAAHIQAL